MSGIQDSDFLEEEQLAFEYVLGTLKGRARSDFEQLMCENEQIQRQVLIWEERLLPLNSTQLVRRPYSKSWHSIEIRIKQARQTSQTKRGWFSKQLWLPWLVSGALSIMLLLDSTMLNQQQHHTSGLPPVDYVAVMTNELGNATLSTLANDKNRRMWLHWEDVELPSEKNYQLWAVSKSDGETRSISVIADTNTKFLSLSEAEWRLVRDADSLILTLEEVGGSAIDEPSHQLIAKGICVRLIAGSSDA